MTLYVLTLNGSESTYVSKYRPKIFTNYDDAFRSMETDYNPIVKTDHKYVRESCLGNIDAYITYIDDTTEIYRIWEVEV